MAISPKLTSHYVRFPSALLIICLSLFLIIPAMLQGRERPAIKDYALIFGTVWGPDDRPVPGVKVKIRKLGEKKPRWEVYSNRRGEFELRLEGDFVPRRERSDVFFADVQETEQRQSDGAPEGMAGDQGERDPDVSVEEFLVGWSRRGIVVCRRLPHKGRNVWWACRRERRRSPGLTTVNTLRNKRMATQRTQRPRLPRK